jgi:ferredoxin
MNNSQIINEKTFGDIKSSSPKKRPYGKTHSPNTEPTEDWTHYTQNFEMSEEFWTLYEKSFWKDYEQNVFKKPKNNFEKMFWEDSEKNIQEILKTRQENKKKFDHDLKIQVDKSLCIACCSCETIAPDVFVIDKISAINPKSKVHNQHGANERKIMDAAKTCPTKAILIRQKDSKKKIYPL